MGKIWLWIFCSLIMASLTAPPHSHAQTYETPGFKIDGEDYTKEQLIWDFTNIAINRNLWLDDSDVPQESVYWFKEFLPGPQKTAKEYRTAFSNHPYIGEYIVRRQGLPKAFSINKWQNKITIGIDWQKLTFGQGEDAHTIFESGFSYALRDPKIYSVFQKNIKDIIPLLERMTGLPVELYDTDDPRDHSSESSARIRVVPKRTYNLRIEKHCRSGGKESCGFVGGAFSLEGKFVTGVAFTQFKNGRAEGYLLPDADNNIGYAACLIEPDNPPSVVKAHIAECLLRALGLPSLSKIKSDALLGDWLKRADPETNKKSWLEDILPAQKKDGRDNATTPPAGITEYDAVMAALLYCPAVKPGMDIYQVIDTLKSDSSQCLEESKNIVKEIFE